MGKYKESPRYRIISVRVSEEERELLERMAREANKSVSDLMREALQLLPPGEERPRKPSRRRSFPLGKQSVLFTARD